MSPKSLLPAVVLALVPLAGCAAGQHDVTSSEHATPWLADANVGPVHVRAVTVVPALAAQTSAAPIPSGASPSPSPSGGEVQAYLTLTLVSSVTDTLTGASLSSGGTVTPTDTTTPLTVRPQQALVIGDPETGGTGTALAITGLTTPVQLGTTVKVTLTFQNAGSVTLDAPIREPAQS